MELYNKLLEQGISEKLIDDVKHFREEYPVEADLADRFPCQRP